MEVACVAVEPLAIPRAGSGPLVAAYPRTWKSSRRKNTPRTRPAASTSKFSDLVLGSLHRPEQVIWMLRDTDAGPQCPFSDQKRSCCPDLSDVGIAIPPPLLGHADEIVE